MLPGSGTLRKRSPRSPQSGSPCPRQRLSEQLLVHTPLGKPQRKLAAPHTILGWADGSRFGGTARLGAAAGLLQAKTDGAQGGLQPTGMRNKSFLSLAPAKEEPEPTLRSPQLPWTSPMPRGQVWPQAKHWLELGRANTAFGTLFCTQLSTHSPQLHPPQPLRDIQASRFRGGSP